MALNNNADINDLTPAIILFIFLIVLLTTLFVFFCTIFHFIFYKFFSSFSIFVSIIYQFIIFCCQSITCFNIYAVSFL